MSRSVPRLVAVVMAFALLAAAACSSDSKGNEKSGGGATVPKETIDYKAIGLWDDGPCDPAKKPLVVGLMTVFESPIVSLKDQAQALDASAKAFNKRGGANGSCVKVHNCDDGANTDQAVACVREIDKAGVMATVNDQGTSGQAEVSAAMAKAGIPRVASNVSQDDWGDPNAFPMDGSGTGGTFMQPTALVSKGVKKIGLIRVDLAAASALKGLLNGILKPSGASVVSDAPVPGGTTDFSQFVLGAQSAGAQGVSLAIGEQEAVQVVKAGQQQNSTLKFAAGFGTFSHGAVADLGDFSKQMVFSNPFAPVTADLPVYKALRADLAASGVEALQPENLKTSPMHSWIGLYALLKMIRDAHMTTFTRQGITDMLKKAKDVPMLNMFGGENWTPDLNHQGIWKRGGMNHWSVYTFDPDKTGPDGFKGVFVKGADLSWDKTLCGSALGGPPPCS
ncbi:MAG: ABC transporter substrate-binding protein [Acidimicrobiia bacterium]|nr:ABC transporter substrate-binding protein [Acidimicrobiia bacterium]